MKLAFSILIGMAALTASMNACRHEPEGTGNNQPEPPPTGGEQACSPDTVYFQNTILPLLVSNCAKSDCHDANSRQDGVELTSYTTIMNTGGVRPGNPGNSDIYEVLLETDPRKVMPRPPN